MTWEAFHARGDVLRAVIEVADRRRDGVLPMDVAGVSETFADDLALIAALQMRWHTRLAGRIERALADEAPDLETAVLSAWRTAAAELAGVREILDAHEAHPTSDEMAAALNRAHSKDRALMAVMAGLASGTGPRAVQAGQRLEDKARAAYRPEVTARGRVGTERATGLLGRLKAHLAA